MDIKRLFTLVLLLSATLTFGQDHENDHSDHDGHDHGTEQADAHADNEHGGDHHDVCTFHHEVTPENFSPQQIAFHHIADANVYSIGLLQLPLPCILYSKESGIDMFLSSKFDFESIGHGTGHNAHNRYILDGGAVKRITDPSFPSGTVKIDGLKHKYEEGPKGKEKEVTYVCYNGAEYRTDAKSTLDGGMFGGGITSFHDFSITKNVTAMIFILLFMLWVFRRVAKAYKTRDGMAPSGMQGFIEPIFLFIRDEVLVPFLGDKADRYLPFIMSIFFFILALNLFGQIPFLGGANVTGSLSVTLVLAVIAFLVTNLSGNKDYWQHIFWMPGVPAWVKTILTPVEFMGVFIKPLTLMLRLFANITAGHIVVIIFVSLIFIFGNVGTNIGGAIGGAVGSTILTMFMMAIELLVAFIQAFVFAILTTSYIGAAVEEHHH
jgi:F-type H+-transporting ATPase subunit a